jgi:hypothetical protein
VHWENGGRQLLEFEAMGEARGHEESVVKSKLSSTLPALPTFSCCVVTCTVPAVAASATSTHKTPAPVLENLQLALQLDQVDSVRPFISLVLRAEHAPPKVNDSNN